MELIQVITEISRKFCDNLEYQKHIAYFNDRFLDHDDLAMDYINANTKGFDIHRLLYLDPSVNLKDLKYTHDKNFMSDNSISSYISFKRQELDLENNFCSSFFSFLKQHKPEIYNLMNSAFAEVLNKNSDILDLNFRSRIADTFIKLLTPADIFNIMQNPDLTQLKNMLNSYKDIMADKDIENMALKNEVKKHTKEKPQPITRKANLILLLDFCNEFLKLNPKAKPEKIIKAFEDEKRYFGGWKSWEPFFIDNFETIKCLTAIPINKKMDGLFAINNRRDQIDKLYAVIEKSHFFK